MAIKIGTDPEVFVANDAGVIGTAIGLIGGDKWSPLDVDRGALQEDNVLAEFNTEPAESADDFVSVVRHVLGQLSEVLNFSGMRPVIKSSHRYDIETLHAAGPQALTFGCDPDFNAYTDEVNKKPDNNTDLRTAGGHVHIGYDSPSSADNRRIGMACDILLGIPSVLLDTDNERRSLYGGAGSIRHKPYGVEYRSLSNFWLQCDEYMRWVFGRAQASVDAASRLEEMWDIVPPAEIQRIINTGDTEAAAEVVERLHLVMPDGTTWM